MCLKETGFEGVDWIHLPQHMKKWRAVVYTALNFGLYNVGIALTEKLAAVQQESSSWQQVFRLRSSLFWDVMRNTPKGRTSHLQRGGNPQSPAATDVSQLLHYTQFDNAYSELSLFRKRNV
jgi:hypothetical protein